MSSTTENLGLTLPDITDFYDVGVTNTNMSLIDSAVGQIADTGAKETSVQSIITSVGTTTDTGGTATTGTVMGKLNAIQSVTRPIKDEVHFYGTTGIPLLATPLTTTLTGSGTIYGFIGKLTPNNAAETLNKLIVTLNVDGETILTHTAYFASAEQYVRSSYVQFTVPELLRFEYTPNTHYFIMPSADALTRTEGSASVYGNPTTTVVGGGSARTRLSVIMSPIQFAQNVTATISCEDYDNENNCMINIIGCMD